MEKISKEDIVEIAEEFKTNKMIYGYHFEEGYNGVYEFVLTCNFPTKQRKINWYNKTIYICELENKESLAHRFARRVKEMHTDFIDDMIGVR